MWVNPTREPAHFRSTLKTLTCFDPNLFWLATQLFWPTHLATSIIYLGSNALISCFKWVSKFSFSLLYQLTVVAHSLNLVLLLGDTALNNLVRFPVVNSLCLVCLICLSNITFHSVNSKNVWKMSFRASLGSEFHTFYYWLVSTCFSSGFFTPLLQHGMFSSHYLFSHYRKWIFLVLFFFLTSLWCRWPYPFLDLSIKYAPLWYVFSNIFFVLLAFVLNWSKIFIS